MQRPSRRCHEDRVDAGMVLEEPRRTLIELPAFGPCRQVGAGGPADTPNRKAAAAIFHAVDVGAIFHLLTRLVEGIADILARQRDPRGGGRASDIFVSRGIRARQPAPLQGLRPSSAAAGARPAPAAKQLCNPSARTTRTIRHGDKQYRETSSARASRMAGMSQTRLNIH